MCFILLNFFFFHLLWKTKCVTTTPIVTMPPYKKKRKITHAPAGTISVFFCSSKFFPFSRAMCVKARVMMCTSRNLYLLDKFEFPLTHYSNNSKIVVEESISLPIIRSKCLYICLGWCIRRQTNKYSIHLSKKKREKTIRQKRYHQICISFIHFHFQFILFPLFSFFLFFNVVLCCSILRYN